MNEDRKLIYSFTTGGPLRVILVALLKDMQKARCAVCGANLADTGYQADHKKYSLDMTLYDLQLLCGPCHAKKTGVKSCNGLLAGFQPSPAFPISPPRDRL